MASGRKPKPTALQIAEGDPRRHGVHKLEERLSNEPRATGGLPRCPSHLKGRARAAWKFWAAELELMNLDKRPDGPMLEGACRAYARAVEADLIIDEQGLIIQDKTYHVAQEPAQEEGKEGKILQKTMTVRTKTHPAVGISNRSWLIVKAFCSEFGLSPVSRTRLSIEQPPADADEFTKMLSTPRAPAATTETIQ